MLAWKLFVAYLCVTFLQTVIGTMPQFDPAWTEAVRVTQKSVWWLHVITELLNHYRSKH